MKPLKLIFCALTLCSATVRAQSGFTAKDLDNFTFLTPSQLQTELKQRSYQLQNQNRQPNEEVQYRYTASTDRNKIFVAIFVKGRITIMDYETTESEQSSFKNSLGGAGFTYKETTRSKGKPIIKYTKSGGLAGKGLEVELSSEVNNGVRYYGILLWNWRTSVSALPEKNTADAKDYNQFDKLSNSTIWVSGTKKFCDDLGLWYITVTVINGTVTIETYPGDKNTYAKNKTKPTSIEKAQVVGNVIYNNTSDGKIKNAFRYINNVFYTPNNEGQYSTYRECNNAPTGVKSGSDVAKLNGSYGTPGGFTFVDGKTTFCLEGQNYIKGLVRKVNEKEYALYFLQPGETPQLERTDWSVYAKDEPIAKFTVINPHGDLKMQWLGLYNRKTHVREYEELDYNPQSVKTLKKD